MAYSRFSMNILPSMSEIMERIRGEDLRKIANTLGVGKGLTRRGDLEGAISSAARTRLSEVVGHCAEDEKKALAEAAHGENGIVDGNVYWGKYGRSFPKSEIAYSARTASPYHVLCRVNEYGELQVADGIENELREILPQPAKLSLTSVDALPPAYCVMRESCGSTKKIERQLNVYAGERNVFLELRRILILAQSDKIRLTPKGGAPTGKSVPILASALVCPDFNLEVPEEDIKNDQRYVPVGPVRAYAWGVLAQQLGWCKSVGERLTLTAAGKTMLAEGTPELFREGFERFLADEEFDELNRIDNIRGQTGNARRTLTSPARRRQSIWASLEDWQEGKWVAFQDAFRFAFATGHPFEVSRNRWDLYFAEKQYGSLGYSGSRGDLERQYMRVFLLEALATLGVVDVAYVYPHRLWPEFDGWWGTDDLHFCGRYDGLAYVRLNSLGAYCLNRQANYEVVCVSANLRCKILPNLEMVPVNSALMGAPELAELETVAERKNDHVWILDRQRILDFVASGGTMSEVRRRLRDMAAGDLPETARVFLDDLEARTNAILGWTEAMLVETRDEAVAVRIANDPLTREYCRLAGKNSLAVPRKNEKAFRTALKKTGYVLPA